VTDGLVSIVIPTFNRAVAVCRTLDSVEAQTYSNWEAVVIDDGSTDGTAHAIAERYGHDPRVRYIYQANEGVSGARNRALAAAQGDYIAFLDSDDTWEPWKLKLQMACFSREPELGMVCTDMMAINEIGEVVHSEYLKVMYRSWRQYTEADLFDHDYVVGTFAAQLPKSVLQSHLFTGNIFSQMITGNLVHTSTIILRREWQRQVGNFDVTLTPTGEDFDYHLRACRLGRIGFVNVSAVRYQTGMADQLTDRKHGVQTSGNFLRTIQKAIGKDRARIHLPEEAIARTLSYAHGWYGQELALAGRGVEARAHLRLSLGYRGSIHAFCFYGLSLLPMVGVRVLRSVGRKLRSRQRKPVDLVKESAGSRAEAG
jgi:glycosyltransferase involved in cell wall biosynthesis